MANLRIEESFELPAEPDRVWAWLVHPEKVVGCLPGAKLEESEGDDTYLGTITVALGAVRVVYRGKAVFEEVDAAGRRLRMKGEGREKTGSGSARMTMESRVEPLEGGGSRTVVEADVQIAGKMVRFGRGMIERVAAEIFSEFAGCLAEKLAAEAEGPGGEGGERSSGVDGTTAAGAEAGGGRERAASGRPGEIAGGDARTAASGDAHPSGSGVEKTLRIGPVLVSVFVGWLADLVDRVRGRTD